MSYSDICYTTVETASAYLVNDIHTQLRGSVKDTKIIDKLKLGYECFCTNNRDNRLVQSDITVTRVMLDRNDAEHKQDTHTVTVNADPENTKPDNVQPNHYGWTYIKNRDRIMGHHVRLSFVPKHHRGTAHAHTHRIMVDISRNGRIKYTTEQELTFV